MTKIDTFGTFRNYTNSQHQKRVQHNYALMHQHQSVDFVQRMKQYYQLLNHTTMDVYNAFHYLNGILDESDPDSDVSQIIHAYQTAEAITRRFIRNDHDMAPQIFIQHLFRSNEWDSLPEIRKKQFQHKTLDSFYFQIQDWSWLPLTGLVHDLGKIMLLPEFGALPQWCVVGDTYPVGAPFSSSNIFYERGYYTASTDYTQHHHETDTTFGCYPRYCGFDNVHMTWGHDEYIYYVMQFNSLLPEESLYILRYHSFYPWHTPQTGRISYMELASEKDWKMLPLLKAFQHGDLYSKLPQLPPIDILKKKYETLLHCYIPKQEVRW